MPAQAMLSDGAHQQQVAGQRAHHPGGRHLADGVVVPFRNIDVPTTVHRHAGREVEPREARAIAAATGYSGDLWSAHF